MTQTSLQFELNEQGKFVRSNDVLPSSIVERVDPRIFSKKHGTRFSGRRVVLFENSWRLWEWEELKLIDTTGGRGRDWRAGGSPLRRSWVAEE